MEIKVTKKDRMNEIIDILNELGGHDELVEFIEHEIDLLNRKKSNKKDKNADVNAALDDRILEVLNEAEGGLAASTILAKVGAIEGIDVLTLPKINSRLSHLGKEAGKIDREKTKKGSIFILGTGQGFNTSEE